MKYSKDDKQRARETLEGMIQPGDKVYTVLRHVSTSGMSRDIGIVVIKSREIYHPNWATACLLDASLNKQGNGVKMGGCGMDMGFHLVYSLSRELFKSGFECIGEKCPSNDHVNEREPNYNPERIHSDPGYALRQAWL